MKNNLHTQDSHVLMMLSEAEKLKTKHEFDASIALLNKIILEEPDCAEAYEELGDNYLSLRDLPKAQTALNQALLVNPQSPNTFYLLGFLSSLKQKWTDSVNYLEKADDLFPNHPEILRCLGWSLYNNNRKTQGIAVLERSTTLSPQDINILCDLGVCYMNTGKFPEARKTFALVIKKAPESQQANECKAFLEIINLHGNTSETKEI
jgi:tetratricopeptide (TPR) repeat protein